MGSSSFSYVQSKNLSIQLSLLFLLLPDKNLQCNWVGPRRKHLRSQDDLGQQTASVTLVRGAWCLDLGLLSKIGYWLAGANQLNTDKVESQVKIGPQIGHLTPPLGTTFHNENRSLQ